MFYYIQGELTFLTLDYAVIDAGGVGYRLTISQRTSQKLRVGNTTRLFTYLSFPREGDMELFGFHTETELNTFKMLIGVSGVGPKAGISILSELEPDQLALAVINEDSKAISKANGIGAKTAARIILELKDKLAKGADKNRLISSGVTLPSAKSAGGGKLSEALDALMVLGYSRAEAGRALSGLDMEKTTLEECIRLALKKLM